MAIYVGTSKAGSFPRGCEVSGFGYSDNYLIVNEKGEQTFYLIQNRSNTQIELERYETREVFMSPTLKSKLDPLRWAAFASDVENLHFKCFTHTDNTTAMVNCSDVLEVCQYPRVKFALSNMGNYWVSTNKPQAQVIKDAIAKGILLRW
nr:enhanced entry protein EnhB [Legionella nagasakiensis]